MRNELLALGLASISLGFKTVVDKAGLLEVRGLHPVLFGMLRCRRHDCAAGERLGVLCHVLVWHRAPRALRRCVISCAATVRCS